ncbi:MAG: DsrE family protein [Desulfatiglandales bacterium]
MTAKKVGVLIRRSPLREAEAAEALRMAVGLTLRDNDMYVFFVDEALETFSQRDSHDIAPGDINRHIDTLIEFDQTIVMEKESMEDLGDFNPPDSLASWTRESIVRFLGECDFAIVV